MAGSHAWPCSTCAYYQPYPAWDGVGTCDNTLSRNYSRMAIGTGEHCEFYSAGPMAAGFGGQGYALKPRHIAEARPSPMTCESCHYWLPFGTMPRVGQCDNPSSRHFGRPTFSDKLTEECYTGRSLGTLEFMWCQTHRQTIHATDLADHDGCSLYVDSASLPAEEQRELTFAGD